MPSFLHRGKPKGSRGCSRRIQSLVFLVMDEVIRGHDSVPSFFLGVGEWMGLDRDRDAGLD